MFAGRRALHFKTAEMAGSTYISPADDLPRFEISDHDARLKNFMAHSRQRSNSQRRVATLGQLLHHPALYRQYPEIEHFQTQVEWGSKSSGSMTANKLRFTYPANVTPEDILPGWLHETQHLIQMIEGFSPGGNVALEFYKLCLSKQENYRRAHLLASSGDARLRIQGLLAATEGSERIAARLQFSPTIPLPHNLLNHFRKLAIQRYRSLPGELEARDTAARRLMRPAERLLTPPVNSRPASHKISDTGVYHHPREPFDIEELKALKELSKSRRRFTGAGYSAAQTP